MDRLGCYKYGFILMFCWSLAFVISSQLLLRARAKVFINTDVKEEVDLNISEAQAVREKWTKKIEQIPEKFVEEKKKCDRPVSTFVFVRTHKTGSTSMRAVLRGYMRNYNLTQYAATYYPWPYSGGYPGLFKCKFMLPKDSLINTEHLRFNAEEMKNCFNPETRYLTILRRPWDNFLSAFNYFKDKQSYSPGCDGMPKVYVKQGKKMGSAEFLSRAADLLNPSVPFFFRYRNPQSHNLGIDPMMVDVNEIETQIKKLDKNMDLVMLLEYLDESLILLKDLLCFDWDVLSTSPHRNRRRYPITTLKDREEKKSFDQLYNIDIALYGHFNRTFWKRVDAYGRERMAKDLETLRHKRNERSMQKKRNKRNNRSIWPSYVFADRKRMDRKLELELRQYMVKNSGKCVYPRMGSQRNLSPIKLNTN